MPVPQAHAGRPRRLILSVLVLLLLPGAAVVWLGVQLLSQDRELEARQRDERRESTADVLAAALEQSVATSERRLRAGDMTWAAAYRDTVALTLRASGVDAYPRGRLLFQPRLPAGDAGHEDPGAFANGEALEYRDRNLSAAAAAFRAAAVSFDPHVRAGALLREARVLRKMGRPDAALTAYREMAQVRAARVLGLPADAVARRTRCALLHDLGRHRECDSEARGFLADLLGGTWALDRGTFEAYLAQAERWVGSPAAVPPWQTALGAAAEWLAAHPDRDAGRQVLTGAGVPVALLWQRVDGGTRAFLGGPDFQRLEWFEPMARRAAARGFRVALSAADDVVVFGDALTGSAIARRRSFETGLPWTMLVGDDGTAQDGSFASRRRLLLAALALLMAIVASGAYFITRSMGRELAVARLQTDFVSAVSHEFRTPLTSLQQFTALLNDAEEPPAAKRKQFYEAQARGVERLRRLVESLLDFGRMEAGARPYRREPLDARSLAGRVTREFEREAAALGFTIVLREGAADAVVTGDEEALSRALWNLLDNAVKYSGESRRIEVSCERDGSCVILAVRDEGLGIPKDEQTKIFDKFVRGEASRTRGIKGTGIGLAMVRHIVSAHGGSVRVRSEPGCGSTFSIGLPAWTEDAPVSSAG